MLTDDQYSILSLIRKSFGVSHGDVTICDPQAAARTIENSGILLTVYKALPADLQEILKEPYYKTLKQSILQGRVGTQALNALADAGLRCIGLKGWELRNLYPDFTMRQMSDLDILVNPYSFGAISAVMKKMGYRGGTKESSSKQNSFRNKEVHIEMHKRLTDESGSIRQWEDGIWGRAMRTDHENIWRMCPEDFCIYHFLHLYRHFMHGAIGLRRIIDTWLLQKLKFSQDAVRAALDGFGIGLFYDRMVKLGAVCMGEAPMDEESEILLTHAFAHGVYGSEKSYKSCRIAAMSSRSVTAGKFNAAMNAVFPPFSHMKTCFPILQRFPVLLPYCWIKRLVRYLKRSMKKNKKKLDYSGIDDQDYWEMKRFFAAGGVDLQKGVYP